jgi:hypothetical protein
MRITGFLRTLPDAHRGQDDHGPALQRATLGAAAGLISANLFARTRIWTGLVLTVEPGFGDLGHVVTSVSGATLTRRAQPPPELIVVR